MSVVGYRPLYSGQDIERKQAAVCLAVCLQVDVVIRPNNGVMYGY